MDYLTVFTVVALVAGPIIGFASGVWVKQAGDRLTQADIERMLIKVRWDMAELKYKVKVLQRSAQVE